MMEIGGFFELPEIPCQDIAPSAFSWLTSEDKGRSVFLVDGRTAIMTVLFNIPDKEEREIYLPSYLCDAVIQPFRELNLRVRYYPHEMPLKPSIPKTLQNAIILIIDYFGAERVSNNQIQDYLNNGNIVIVDNTHSLLNSGRFDLKHENFFLIASIRKFFSIPDGGIVYHNRENFHTGYENSYQPPALLEAMILKKQFLDCRNGYQRLQREQIKDSFLTMYRDHDQSKAMTEIKIRDIPRISKEILKQTNISTLIQKRKANLDFLYDHINHPRLFLFKRDEIQSPFILPLIFRDEAERDNTKHILIDNDVYPPIHWDLRNVIPDSFRYEHDLSKKILSIPVDQRYNEKDMSRIVSILNDVVT